MNPESERSWPARSSVELTLIHSKSLDDRSLIGAFGSVSQLRPISGH